VVCMCVAVLYRAELRHELTSVVWPTTRVWCTLCSMLTTSASLRYTSCSATGTKKKSGSCA
jgi:hypothetical protein